MRKHIPNMITSLNVLSGTMAILMSLYGEMEYAVFYILLGMFFDFFDGLAARLLQVKSRLGKELDSLADVITFGVAPALLAHYLIRDVLLIEGGISDLSIAQQFFVFSPLLIPAFSAYRLAKFNLDTRQTTSFIGLPVPAHALFWVSLVIARSCTPEFYGVFFYNVWVLTACIVILSLLLVSELPMFSLKLSNFTWSENRLRYIYFALLLLIILIMKWGVILFIIPLYILVCVIEALLTRSTRKQNNQ